MLFQSCDSDFNIDRHFVSFLQDTPFFAELSRQIRKTATLSIPTAAIAFDAEADECSMFYNPNFFKKLGDYQIRGTIVHELYHFIFGHLNVRRRTPHKLWNVATDLAINSIIVANAHETRKNMTGDPLPDCVLIPGQWPRHPEGRELSQEEKSGAKLAGAIASFPPNKASEWYFNQLFALYSEPGDGPLPNEPWFDSFDDHGAWDNVPSDMWDYIQGRVKSIVERAVINADKQSNGWGRIPADIRAEIRNSVLSVIDWRAVLRQFIGSLLRGNRYITIKRINKRYPYIHPDTKKGYSAKLLIAIDQSGSVSDEMLAMFFGELASLTKRTTVDILPFDSTCDVDNMFTWARGTVPNICRTRSGGTNFDAVSRFVNHPLNRGRWNGLLIMTDGECDAPSPTRIKRGWILPPEHKLFFLSNEMQIVVNKTMTVTGAWR